MNDLNKQGAIWFPIFSREAAFWLIGFASLFIFSLIVFLPREATTPGALKLFSFMTSIADVGYKASLSSSPFRIAITYGFLLIIAPIFAGIFCCTRLNIGFFSSYFKEIKISSRVIRVLAAFLIAGAPYLLPLAISPGGLGYKTLLAICNNRFWFLVFCHAALIAFPGGWLYMFAEFTNFIVYLTGGNRGTSKN